MKLFLLLGWLNVSFYTDFCHPPSAMRRNPERQLPEITTKVVFIADFDHVIFF